MMGAFCSIRWSGGSPVALKAVLFDNDGTLVDTHDIILASFRYASQEVLGRVYPDEVYMAKVGQPLAVQVDDFTSDAAVKERFLKVYRAHNATIHDKMIKAFPGLIGLLERLRDEGFALGVVTSKMRNTAWGGLVVVGAAPYFECIVGSEDTEAHKPSPEPVLLGCEKLGVAASECVYVGDAPFDIEAGVAAGCATIGVTWGMFNESVLREQHATAIASTMDELAVAIEALR